jgi:hypothetical protein
MIMRGARGGGDRWRRSGLLIIIIVVVVVVVEGVVGQGVHLGAVGASQHELEARRALLVQQREIHRPSALRKPRIHSTP